MSAAPLRLATRGSPLAMAQAELAAAALTRAGVAAIELIAVRTRGDADQRSVEALEGEGWFTGELEAAILEDRADAAVHSAKDLPTELAPGLRVAAHLERADPRDALVLAPGAQAVGLRGLPEGAVVGTSSPRRACLLLAARPDLRIVPMRGNVDTRLGKLDAGEVDGLVLACAGLDRLGRGERATVRLDPRRFVPAPAQGAVAIECAGAMADVSTVARADHAATTAAVLAERRVLSGLGGGCRLPLGAWARVEGSELVLSAAIEGGGGILRAEVGGSPAAPLALGDEVAARLRR